MWKWTPRTPRTIALAAVAAIVLDTAAGAASVSTVDQDDVTAPKLKHTSSEVEFGGRAISGDRTSSKYSEYRDHRPRPVARFSVFDTSRDHTRYFEGTGIDVSERDQRYEFAYARSGRFRLELGFDELPHVFSNVALSPYAIGDGVLTLDDRTQLRIQNAPGGVAGQSNALRGALALAPLVPLDFKVLTGRFGYSYHPDRRWELSGGYSNKRKSGTRPFGMGFGSPGNNFVNVPAPIDDRIHDVRASAEYVRDDHSLRFDYNGNFYRNDIDSLTVDNPLRLGDSAVLGPGRGRTDLFPDNESHTFSLTGAKSFHLDFPLRLAGTLSLGRRYQDDPFLPHTINSAVRHPFLALPAPNLDGRIDTFLANFVLTGRPAPRVNLTGRYRFYNMNSKTALLTFPAHVVNDRTLTLEGRTITPTEYYKENVAADATWRIADPVSMKLGYEWERWERPAHREVGRTEEDMVRAAVDVRPDDRVLVRIGYLFGIRQFDAYDTFAHLAHAVEDEPDFLTLSQSQTVLLRKYDQANRIRKQGSVLAQVSPTDKLTVGVSSNFGNNDYDTSPLGLVNDRRWSVGTDTTYQASDRLALSSFYTYERIRAEQRSRARPRSVVPPIRVFDSFLNDWQSVSLDQVNAWGGSADWTIRPRKLETTISYTGQRAHSKTLATQVPGRSLPAGSADGGNAVDWPELRDSLEVLSAILRHHLEDDLTLKGEYRYEHYSQQNFKVDPLAPFMIGSNVNASGAVAPSTDVFLGDRVGNYNVHAFTLSAVHRF
jgi:MtrB/PioB family decaheme-associated outer membrane protein